MQPDIKQILSYLLQEGQISKSEFAKGQQLYFEGRCQTLSLGKLRAEILIDDDFGDFELFLEFKEDIPHFKTKGEKETLDAHIVACLLHYEDELRRGQPVPIAVGKAYTREGMIRRVLEERKAKAAKAEYRIEFDANPYGEHILYNEKGQDYRLTFHDLKKETGYCSCPDFQSNKLGTCKHLLFAYQAKKGEKESLRKPRARFPFVDVFLDPLNDYRIAYFHPDPEQLPDEMQALLGKYFDKDQVEAGGQLLPQNEGQQFLRFIQQAEKFKQILIRPEVYHRIDKTFQDNVLRHVKSNYEIDWSVVNAQLYPYQKKGIEFAAFRSGVIIADEMGLGKTLQAIATALVKKDAFGFEKTLVICPASVKEQWKQEIEKFSDAKAILISGPPEERERLYQDEEAFFFIINYETVLRDRRALNRMDLDFIILDEAQRIKNYETQTARSIKDLEKKHSLVITGTPIENRLLDLFSIMDFVDPQFLTPLWEFSYQHCYFDEEKKNKIVGYFNLQELKSRLKDILIRRTKREVIQEMPKITQLNIPVPMHPEQAFYHTNYARGVSKLLQKKYLTPYDFTKLMLLMNQMRMVCDSTFLVDKETHFSPKLNELKFLLTEKLDVLNNSSKVIIFSEWVRMNGLIGKLLREIGINYVELNGKVPVEKRQVLVDKFYEDPECKVFLSTEAGGTGLNLQVADTVINFELPWNPAKKNQRIGRIDRLGQSSDQLTIINLITQNSIEVRIASGLMLKENLFENVLNSDSLGDVVDFSQKGRAQFLQQIEQIMGDIEAQVENERQEAIELEESLARETAYEDLREELGELISDGDEAIEPTKSPPQTREVQEIPEKAELVASQGGSEEKASKKELNEQSEQMEKVMNQGMDFLAGMFKMMTGKDMGAGDKKIEIDRETGEVVMRFKMPGF